MSTHSHSHHATRSASASQRHGAESLNRTAARATLHCLTGCAIGEVLGMVIGTALGWSNPATIALAIVLAFFFGYALTMAPLVRSGLALGIAVPIAFAADSLSIAVMEIVDNGVMLAVPGAMDSPLTNPLFWGALAFALVVAFIVAFPLNRVLISRGLGHAGVHAHHGDAGDGAPQVPASFDRRTPVLIGAASVAVTLLVAVGGAILVEGGHDEPATPVHGHEGEVSSSGRPLAAPVAR